MLLGGNGTLCQGLMSSTGDLLRSKNCVRPSIYRGKLVWLRRMVSTSIVPVAERLDSVCSTVTL